MPRRLSLPAILLLALGVAAGPAFAQDSNEPRLPASILRPSGVLDEAQTKTINEYVIYWIDLLNAGTDEEIAQARDKLAQPFKLGNAANDIFLAGYAAAIKVRLSEAMKSNRLIVKINAMLVLQYLTEEGVVELLRQGLEDQAPAVRYRAAKAAGEVARRDAARGEAGRLNEEQKLGILAAIRQAFGAETDELVMEQLLTALIGLVEMPQARQYLLTKVNDRVSVHHRNPNLPAKAGIEAIQTFTTRLAREKAQGNLDPEEAKQVAVVCLRWFDVSAIVLDEDRADERMRGQYQKLLQATDKYLRWALRALAPEIQPPNEIDDMLRSGDWKFIRVLSEEWKAKWQQSPMSLPAREMQVP